MRLRIFIFFVYLASLASRAQTGPGAMLPDKDDIPGWRTAGQIKIFSKEALPGFSKEESGILTEYGFDYAAEQSYYNYSNRLINAKVYVMKSSFGSCGLFMRSSRDQNTFREYGNSAYTKAGEYGFWKQYYFVKLTSGSEGDTISEGYRLIAAFIDSKIRSKGIIPDILGFSEGKAGNVTIFKGPLALSEIYYFSPLNIFFIQEGIAIDNGKSMEIFLRYSDNNEAVRRFTEVAGILGEMTRFSDFIMLENFSFAMKDRERKTLVFKVTENNIHITIR